MSTVAQQVKIRRIILTGAITAITVTGAWYGAGLKTKSEINQVSLYLPVQLSACSILTDRMMLQAVQQRREASPAERIAQLEERKGALVAKRFGLEKKIREVEARRKGTTREESMAGMERRR